ncbi:DNA topoisomerase III [Spirochaeta cellobiosiphila]|uniref:DNA topoisomerase III n=1 Tax=Spirochaeta cellobiosiphila TaxID=504483 RepID=UPI00048F63C6|nr:DNA topoisomerase III [Spirochaeta cellobiosiphila]
MKSIVLAEKPSVGRDIAKVLGCNKSTKTHIEGAQYIVTWAMGHLVELAEPGVYDSRYTTWSLDYLPMLPEKMKLKVIRKTSHQFNAIKRLMQRNDVDHLIIATDAGREGEAVARNILKLGAWKKKTSRLWISSQTTKAIKEGFAHLEPAQKYWNLYLAAEARSEADWIIGLNLSRALSCKYDSQLTCGRVQTPTLALIAEREKTIKNFIPQDYWTIEGKAGDKLFRWQDDKGQSRIFKEARVEEIISILEGSEGTCTERKNQTKSEHSPLAYDLTELQRDANKWLGFGAKQTLKVLQSLYERHKIVTYPRTDSRHITTDMVPTLGDRLKALSKTSYASKLPQLDLDKIKNDKMIVNNAKVSDHHAIIPTEERVNLDRLNPEERNLWQLIVNRFLEVLSPAYKYNQISIKIKLKEGYFFIKSRQTLDKGWRAITGRLPDNEENEVIQDLQNIKEGDTLNINGIHSKKSKTSPPSRYTEGTLLTAMENPSALVDSKEYQKVLKEEGGLGTPATRADIIEKLFSSFYAEKQGHSIHPTSRGLDLLSLVPEEIKSPNLTAIWEQRLNNIATGKENPQAFKKDIRDSAQKLTDLIKLSKTVYEPKGNGKPCPMCGKPLLDTKDKRGRAIQVCRSLSCGYESTSEVTPGGKPGRKEQALGRKLIKQYSSQDKETYTLADMLKEAQKKKDKKK